MTNWETSFQGGFDDFKPQQNFVSVNDLSQAFNGLSGQQQNQSFSNLQGNQNQRFQPYNTQPQRYSTNQPMNTNLSQNTQTRNQTIKPEFSNIEEQKFLQLLKQVSSNGSGSISASSCANFLRTTSLPNRILADIWDLADHKKQGFLQIEGFFIAMRAVALYQHHQKLIPELIYKKAPKNESSLLPKIGSLKNIDLNKNTSTSTQQTIKPNSSNNQKTSFKQLSLSSQIEHKQNINTTEVAKPSSSNQNQPLNLLKISQKEHQNYSKTYSQLDINNDGFVTGQNNKVINLMRRSKLDNEILSRIWDLCSDEKKLKIYKNNFILTLHLINCTKIGITIPPNFDINSITFEKKSNENQMNGLGIIKPQSNGINNNQQINSEPFNQQQKTGIQKNNSQKNLFENLFNESQNLTFQKTKSDDTNSKSQKTLSNKEENITIIQNFEETKNNENIKTKEQQQIKEMEREGAQDIKLGKVIEKNEIENKNEKPKTIINENNKFESLKKLENSYPNEKNNIINKDLNTFESNNNQNDLLLNNSTNTNHSFNQNNEINNNSNPKTIQNNQMNLYNHNTYQQIQPNGNYNTRKMPNQIIKPNEIEAIDTIAIQKMKKEVKNFNSQLNFYQKEIEKLTSTFQLEKQKEEDVLRNNQYLKLQIKRLNDEKKVLKNNYVFLKNTLENLTYQNIEYKYILDDRMNYNNNEKKRIKNLQKGKKKIQKVLLQRQKILSKINENKKINKYQIEQLSKGFDFQKFLIRPKYKQKRNNLFNNVTDKERGQMTMEANKQNLSSGVDIELIKPEEHVLYRPEEVFNTFELEKRTNTKQYKNKSEYGDDESELDGFSGGNETTLSDFSESNSVKIFSKAEIETETFSEMTTYITSGETTPKNLVHEIDNLQIKNNSKKHRIEEFDNFDNFSQNDTFNTTNSQPNTQKNFDDFGKIASTTQTKNNDHNNLTNFDNFKNETFNNSNTESKKNIKLKNIKNIKIQYKSNRKKSDDLHNHKRGIKKNQEDNKDKAKTKKENTHKSQTKKANTHKTQTKRENTNKPQTKTKKENKNKTKIKKEHVTKKKKRNKKIKKVKNKEKKSKKNINHSHKGHKKNKDDHKAKTKTKKENAHKAQTKKENAHKIQTKKENTNKPQTKGKKENKTKTKTKKENKNKTKIKKENVHKKKKIIKKNKNSKKIKIKNSNKSLKNFDSFDDFEKGNKPNQTSNANNNDNKNSKNNNFQNFNDFNNFNSQNIDSNKTDFKDFDKFGDFENKQNDKQSQPKETAFDNFSQNNTFNSSNNQNGFTFDDFGGFEDFK
ncbi:epidermal growth factor receptor pathway substrate [Anaeramoeba flamelloides]|uniref:Epidermal growth factor receptor pathway substrate n=1 Tax=Anaeramoeba flamelloides TaxID=1746091 RepID=A0AAV7ZDX6_9EUKA|nr:epidermal growth factor receptor pathway substrate [Anaeramoeba flamelloides]